MELYLFFGFLGMLLVFVGSIYMIVQGCRVHFGWGLALFLMPMITIVFVFKHWDKAKNPLHVIVLGIASFALAMYLEPVDHLGIDLQPAEKSI